LIVGGEINELSIVPTISLAFAVRPSMVPCGSSISSPMVSRLKFDKLVLVVASF
jgi:hypothetical protein